jgi:hypothetical protein
MRALNFLRFLLEDDLLLFLFGLGKDEGGR